MIAAHGGGGYGRLFAPIGKLLHGAGYEVVAPDPPGYGLSRAPSSLVTYKAWTDLLCDLAEHWATRSIVRRQAGTISDRTRTPLTVWFAACWHFASGKDGISALSLKRTLEIGSYQTAWAMLHRLRSVLIRPDRELLRGKVEVDLHRWARSRVVWWARSREKGTDMCRCGDH
ncbi:MULTISPECIES: alpha/beta fold hydrolase [Cupriavidus]|uniref:alpha/beta fold hydrolase n=1 Tax=Cupriavidus TaxID=106589 RepID=UPI001F2BD038|nr:MULTISPECIES: alpha/beta fold hydrolase [Cupriavidus]MDF3885246.1 hypothetical protein [Cupriavidus basilensis]